MTSPWKSLASLLAVFGLAVFGLAVFGFVAAPSVASADTAVVVLGIRSVEGDDEFARNLTGALRRAAEQVPGLRVVDRDVSLAQMMLVFTCDEPDAACLEQIAGELRVARIVYGTARRTATGDNYNYALSLYSFDSGDNEIDQQLTATVPRARSDIDDLRPAARGWMSVLAGLPQVGSIVVRGATNGAQVLVDGEAVGVVARGTFTARAVRAGGHLVEVQAEGQPGFRQRVNVEVGDTITLDARRAAAANDASTADVTAGEASGAEAVHVELDEPEDTVPSEGGSSFGTGFWVGVGASALGAAMIGLTAYSWVALDSVDNDADWLAYRAAAAAPGQPNGVDDICVPAEAGLDLGTPAGTVDRVRSLCSTANTFEPLQYVFLGLGIVGLGTGIYLISSGLGSDEEPASASPAAGSLSVRPVFGLRQGGLEARLTF
jgi:hypothetical protein